MQGESLHIPFILKLFINSHIILLSSGCDFSSEILDDLVHLVLMRHNNYSR